MSLINKMLQDLDARGTPAGEALPGQVKPVARAPRGPNLRLIAACIGATAAGLGLAWFGWTQYQHRHAAPQPRPMQLAPAVQPAVAGPVAAPVAQPLPAPVPVSASATGPAVDAAAPPQPAAAGAPSQTAAPLEPDSAEARAARQALSRELNARTRNAGTAAPAAATPVREPAPLERLRRQEQARFAAAAAAEGSASAADADAAADAAGGMQPAQGRHADGRQRAEGEYRRALALTQEGRIADGIAALESALRIEPSHEAARQTLVGLLVEAGRHDDALRQAQVGLTLDPRQPALAMLLARLQMEHGGNGIDTLLRTLPYAGNNPDYRAFLAAALERQQRHREAAEQYGAALRLAPANGVWWMGLGMALQGDKRNGEALDAFQKARAAGLPSPELQEFVERRILQLGR